MIQVLLIDDDADLTALLGAQLVHLGFEVSCAHTVAEALESVQGAEPVDVLVSDRHLPDGDAALVGELIPARLRFALSGSPCDELPGFAAVFAKPLRAAELAEAIRSMLEASL